jgi:RNA polymerase sigma-70 factor (ECF subfamily)
MSDPERFEAFVRRYQDMVFAAAVRLVGSPADAEDIAQTVFLRAYQRFGGVDDHPAASPWLKTVTRNACLNHLSRYRARWRFFSELTPPGGTHEAADFGATLAAPEGSSPLEDAARAAALEQALRALPDHQRVPLVLFHFDEMSYQAIADLLGVSLGKVKTDIHRGREALKRLLGGRRGVA